MILERDLVKKADMRRLPESQDSSITNLWLDPSRPVMISDDWEGMCHP